MARPLGDSTPPLRPLDHLRVLAGLPHRGSGTPEEAAAADRCAALLRGWGYDVTVQPFTAPRQTLYNGILFLLAAFIGAAVMASLWTPWAGLVLGLALLIPIAGELTGGRPDFDVFVPKATSRNVIATLPGATAIGDAATSGTHGDAAAPGTTASADATGNAGTATFANTASGAARPHVILTAHVDTQLGSILFAPWFVRITPHFFTLCYAAIAAALVAFALQAGGVAPAVARGLLIGAVCVMAAGFAFILTAKLGGRYVNGANDNGSGVAIALAIAEAHRHSPLPVDLTVLITGAEEVGERGMKHFMATAGRHLDRANTYFVNLDNVGGGILRYQLGEGMVAYYKYSPVLIGLAEQLAASAEQRMLPLKNTMLPTDSLIPARQRFHTITFLAQDEDGTIPHYHWHTDTMDTVDPEVVEFTGRFIWQYVAALPEWVATHGQDGTRKRAHA